MLTCCSVTNRHMTTVAPLANKAGIEDVLKTHVRGPLDPLDKVMITDEEGLMLRVASDNLRRVPSKEKALVRAGKLEAAWKVRSEEWFLGQIKIMTTYGIRLLRGGKVMGSKTDAKTSVWDNKDDHTQRLRIVRVFWMQHLMDMQLSASGFCAAEHAMHALAVLTATDIALHDRVQSARSLLIEHRAPVFLDGKPRLRYSAPVVDAAAAGSNGSGSGGLPAVPSEDVSFTASVLIADLRYRVVQFHSKHDWMWREAMACKVSEQSDDIKYAREIEAKTRNIGAAELKRRAEKEKKDQEQALVSKDTNEVFEDLREVTPFGKTVSAMKQQDFMLLCLVAIAEEVRLYATAQPQVPSSSSSSSAPTKADAKGSKAALAGRMVSGTRSSVPFPKRLETMVYLAASLYEAVAIQTLVFRTVRYDFATRRLKAGETIADATRDNPFRAFVDSAYPELTKIVQKAAAIDTSSWFASAFTDFLQQLYAPAGLHLMYRRRYGEAGDLTKNEAKYESVVSDTLPTTLSYSTYTRAVAKMGETRPVETIEEYLEMKNGAASRAKFDDLFLFMFDFVLKSHTNINLLKHYSVINEAVYSNLHRFLIHRPWPGLATLYLPFLFIHGTRVAVYNPAEDGMWICADKSEACLVWLYLVCQPPYNAKTEVAGQGIRAFLKEFNIKVPVVASPVPPSPAPSVSPSPAPPPPSASAAAVPSGSSDDNNKDHKHSVNPYIRAAAAAASSSHGARSGGSSSSSSSCEGRSGSAAPAPSAPRYSILSQFSEEQRRAARKKRSRAGAMHRRSSSHGR